MNKEQLDSILAGSPSKGQPLTPDEALACYQILRRLSYRIRHAEGQESNGRLTAGYYLGQGLMNVEEYLAPLIPPATLYSSDNFKQKEQLE